MTRLPLPDGNNIVEAKRKLGLRSLAIERDKVAAAFHTDRGVDIYHEHHIEHLTIPDTDKDPAVLALASAALTAVVLTDEGVHVYERGEALRFNVGERVYDVATIDDARLTLVAMGDRLEAVFHAAPEAGPQLVYRIDARRVVADRKGGAITDDDLDIMR